MFVILVFLLGIIAIVIFSFNAFQTVRGTERNAFAWTALVAVIGLSIQIILPVLLLILIAIAISIGLITEQGLNSTVFLSLVIQVISIIASVGTMMAILSYLSKIPDSDEINSVPPPPTNFNLS